MQTLKERDKLVNWHPYTAITKANTIIPIIRGESAYLFDENNTKYIDAISSWWVNLHGHAHPYIAEKIYAQLNNLTHVIFAGFTHRPAIELSERLLILLPKNQKKCFYSDNGSTAVEIALKMCLQYHHNKQQDKTVILAFKNAYHGDTFGAMSVSSRGIWTAPFQEKLFEVVFIDIPTTENNHIIKEQILKITHKIACFIYEPLVQGAAGMLMYEVQYLDELMTFCIKHKILLIQDEIFVGFGRTGKLFAADHLKEIPDLMCFSKGLTGGNLPLGITTCSEAIHHAFYADKNTKTFFHGHSFTANPLACTAALASLDLLLLPETQHQIENIIRMHRTFMAKIKNNPKLKSVRQCGTILAIEWNTETETSYFNGIQEKLYSYFLIHGILIRPLGNIIYLVPPYCVSTEDLTYIYQIILKASVEIQ